VFTSGQHHSDQLDRMVGDEWAGGQVEPVPDLRRRLHLHRKVSPDSNSNRTFLNATDSDGGFQNKS
jgi:hypothetical protein